MLKPLRIYVAGRDSVIESSNSLSQLCITRSDDDKHERTLSLSGGARVLGTRVLSKRQMALNVRPQEAFDVADIAAALDAIGNEARGKPGSVRPDGQHFLKHTEDALPSHNLPFPCRLPAVLARRPDAPLACALASSPQTRAALTAHSSQGEPLRA